MSGYETSDQFHITRGHRDNRCDVVAIAFVCSVVLVGIEVDNLRSPDTDFRLFDAPGDEESLDGTLRCSILS